MLIGETVIVRPVERSDIPEYTRRLNDINQLGDFWPSLIRTPLLIERAFEDSGFSTQKERILLVTDHANSYIGEIILTFTEEMLTTHMLSYRVFATEKRNKGYMSEAVKLFCAWFFEANPMERLTVFIAVGNDASRRIAEKAGFQFEGIMRRAQFIRGKYLDMQVFSLLRDEAPSLVPLLRQRA